MYLEEIVITVKDTDLVLTSDMRPTMQRRTLKDAVNAIHNSPTGPRGGEAPRKQV